MTDGSERPAGLSEKRPVFFSIFSMEPARRASSGSHVSPEVAGARGQPPTLLVDFFSSAVAIAIDTTRWAVSRARRRRLGGSAEEGRRRGRPRAVEGPSIDR